MSRGRNRVHDRQRMLSILSNLLLQSRQRQRSILYSPIGDRDPGSAIYPHLAMPLCVPVSAHLPGPTTPSDIHGICSDPGGAEAVSETVRSVQPSAAEVTVGRVLCACHSSSASTSCFPPVARLADFVPSLSPPSAPGVLLTYYAPIPSPQDRTSAHPGADVRMTPQNLCFEGAALSP
jgi:hypothetical protein